MIENRMVVDSEWWFLEHPVLDDYKKKLCGPGREEIGTGIFVPEEDAFDYAMKRVCQDEDSKQEFVEWFYSGNWIKED